MFSISNVTNNHQPTPTHTQSLEFLKQILPPEGRGLYCMAVFPPQMAGPPRHIYKKTLSELAALADRYDAMGCNVFHACATYRTSESRKQSNTAQVRSYWLDLDVKPGQYDSQRKAAESVAAFCTTTGLPGPMIISSGKGLHCYWPLAEAIPATEWKATALTLAQCLDHRGVLHDRSRTTDEASILRPVGTHHRKGEPLPVKLLRRCEAIEHAQFVGAIRAYADAHALTTPCKSNQAAMSALSAGMQHDHLPSSFTKVIKGCAAMREAAAVGGGSEPMWRAMLGLIKNCTEGEALAHEISARDPRYDPAETQRKLDGWTAGPPLCCHVAQHSTACATCPEREGAA